LKKLLHVRVVYQELDSPAAVEGSDLGVALRFCLAARRSLAVQAEACVLPNEGRALAFSQAVGTDAPVVTAMNCPVRDEGSIARTAADRPEFRITYHGSLNPTRLPLSVVHALAVLPEETTLQLIGYETVGAAGYAQLLRRRMLDLGLGDRVRVMGVVPERNALLGLCRDSDVGLALMASEDDLNERTIAGACQKVFEYPASWCLRSIPLGLEASNGSRGCSFTASRNCSDPMRSVWSRWDRSGRTTRGAGSCTPARPSAWGSGRRSGTWRRACVRLTAGER